MNFKELQSMLLENEYFITFQSMNSDKVYTKKCTLKETPNKVNQKEGSSIHAVSYTHLTLPTILLV